MAKIQNSGVFDHFGSNADSAFFILDNRTEKWSKSVVNWYTDVNLGYTSLGNIPGKIPMAKIQNSGVLDHFGSKAVPAFFILDNRTEKWSKSVINCYTAVK